MKNLIISLTAFFVFSCNQNNFTKSAYGSDVKIIDSTENKKAEDITTEFCIEIDTLPRSNYYQVDLDTFLNYHHLKKNIDEFENKKFHQGTKDFISSTEAFFYNYPYEGKAFVIKKINISKNITAILYAYLLDSEIVQPRIEIQTFNDKKENIDNLIVASTFSSECSGYRNFCLKDRTVKIHDFYFCDETNLNYQKNYEFKINNEGKFVKQK